MAFITKTHSQVGTSNVASNNGTNGQNNEISQETLSSLNVKSELRPLARDLVSKAQELGIADQVDASRYREEIKRKSKSNVVDLAQAITDVIEDKTGGKL